MLSTLTRKPRRLVWNESELKVEDLDTFLNTVHAIATGSAEAIQRNESDVMGEIESSALLAAANAFATYQMCRALRREYDARQATRVELGPDVDTIPMCELN